MNKIRLGGLTLGVALFSVLASGATVDFWNSQHKGTNFFNEVETADRMAAAKKLGVDFIRMTPTKWRPAERDFLIGNADEFTAIPKADLDQLKKRLDEAAAQGLKVIITPLSLPGARWAAGWSRALAPRRCF